MGFCVRDRHKRKRIERSVIVHSLAGNGSSNDRGCITKFDDGRPNRNVNIRKNGFDSLGTTREGCERDEIRTVHVGSVYFFVALVRKIDVPALHVQTTKSRTKTGNSRNDCCQSGSIRLFCSEYARRRTEINVCVIICYPDGLRRCTRDKGNWGTTGLGDLHYAATPKIANKNSRTVYCYICRVVCTPSRCDRLGACSIRIPAYNSVIDITGPIDVGTVIIHSATLTTGRTNLCTQCRESRACLAHFFQIRSAQEYEIGAQLCHAVNENGNICTYLSNRPR